MKFSLFAKFYNPIYVEVGIADMWIGERWLMENVIFDHWDYWMDGNYRYHGFLFKNPEDAVAFKLKFG